MSSVRTFTKLSLFMTRDSPKFLNAKACQDIKKILILDELGNNRELAKRKKKPGTKARNSSASIV